MTVATAPVDMHAKSYSRAIAPSNRRSSQGGLVWQIRVFRPMRSFTEQFEVMVAWCGFDADRGRLMYAADAKKATEVAFKDISKLGILTTICLTCQEQW